VSTNTSHQLVPITCPNKEELQVPGSSGSQVVSRDKTSFEVTGDASAFIEADNEPSSSAAEQRDQVIARARERLALADRVLLHADSTVPSSSRGADIYSPFAFRLYFGFTAASAFNGFGLPAAFCHSQPHSSIQSVLSQNVLDICARARARASVADYFRPLVTGNSASSDDTPRGS
jgi:hypothetical protein